MRVLLKSARLPDRILRGPDGALRTLATNGDDPNVRRRFLDHAYRRPTLQRKALAAGDHFGEGIFVVVERYFDQCLLMILCRAADPISSGNALRALGAGLRGKT